MEESLTSVTLRIPIQNAGCADWLLLQTPAVVADTLSLCEVTYKVLKNEVSFIEALKTSDDHHKGLHSLQQQLLEVVELIEKRHREEMTTKVRALEDELAVHKKLSSNTEELLRSQLQSNEASLLDERQARNALARDYMQRFESIAGRLTGNNTFVGQIGEKLVDRVFSHLQLGTLQDDHTNPAEGFADGLWTYQPSDACPKLRCLIEVKLVASIHSRDMSKFERDLHAAVSMGRCNCGMLISLGARCAGMPSLHLTLLHGIPVIYMSRDGEDDVLPAASAIEIAFRSLAEAWPFISRGQVEGDSLAMSAIAGFLNDQYNDIDRLNKSITSIMRSALSLKREAINLEKIRDNLITGIDSLRLKYPSLVPALSDTIDAAASHSIDPWSSEGAKDLLQAIKNWKTAKRRYPRSIDDLRDLLSEASKTFLQITENAFILAVDVLKKEYRRNTSLPTQPASLSQEADMMEGTLATLPILGEVLVPCAGHMIDPDEFD